MSNKNKKNGKKKNNNRSVNEPQELISDKRSDNSTEFSKDALLGENLSETNKNNSNNHKSNNSINQNNDSVEFRKNSTSDDVNIDDIETLSISELQNLLQNSEGFKKYNSDISSITTTILTATISGNTIDNISKLSPSQFSIKSRKIPLSSIDEYLQDKSFFESALFNERAILANNSPEEGTQLNTTKEKEAQSEQSKQTEQRRQEQKQLKKENALQQHAAEKKEKRQEHHPNIQQAELEQRELEQQISEEQERKRIKSEGEDFDILKFLGLKFFFFYFYFFFL